jgi:hypothetical protein
MRHSSSCEPRPRNRQHCKSVILCDLLKLHYRHLNFAIAPQPLYMRGAFQRESLELIAPSAPPFSSIPERLAFLIGAAPNVTLEIRVGACRLKLCGRTLQATHDRNSFEAY